MTPRTIVLPKVLRPVAAADEENTMVDENKVKGGAKELGGKIKEGVGNLVGNDRIKADGIADQAEGKTQKNYGKVKDAVKDQAGR